MCKVAIFNLLMDTIIMIILICLIVENAITFFMSISMLASIPPKINVLSLITINILFKDSSVINFLSFMFKKIPAVTRVDECTIAEMGVGADIAAGSQDDIGIWALLVRLHIKINVIIRFLDPLSSWLFSWALILIKLILKVTINILSPTRLKNIVISEFFILVLLG